MPGRIWRDSSSITVGFSADLLLEQKVNLVGRTTIGSLIQKIARQKIVQATEQEPPSTVIATAMKDGWFFVRFSSDIDKGILEIKEKP